MIIKSITTVRVSGAANGNWCIRARLTDERELFYGIGDGLMLDQASAVLVNIPFRAGQDESVLSTTFGTGFGSTTYDFQPLPAGCKVIR